MLRMKDKKGFTLAEALIVVAIISVLAAVAVVAVFAHMRSMAKLEYDGYAKEIFIAAQNHLSMSDGYLGRENFGNEEGRIDGIEDTGVYYFVKSPDRDDVNDTTSVLNLMLPVAAVDETVRLGGCYIIRYHKDSAQVLDVFYWEDSGRYKHTYVEDDYANFIRNREDKNALRSYSSDNSVIGYYGGTDAQNLTYGEKLQAPVIVVENSDKLTVTVTDFNSGNTDANLKLIITGKTSKKSREITLSTTGVSTYYSNEDISSKDSNYIYNIVLDDITTSDKHFYNLFCTGENPLIAGEDIEIQAVSYNNTQLTNVAYSSKQTTNSLFAYNDTEDKTAAHISNIRHLENLDKSISNLGNDSFTFDSLDYADNSTVKAYQTTDLSWREWKDYDIYGFSGSKLTEASYKPVTPDYTLQYNGGNHTLSDVVVKSSGNAGMFGKLSNGKIENLKLLDFEINGANAGALAGLVENAEITNVLAINSDGNSSAIITGIGSVGGLIGEVKNSSIIKCAAALIVKSTGGNAGGLIGTVRDAESGDKTTVTACYSGGHTVNGKYSSDEDKFNVTGTQNVGGLIGYFSGEGIYQSYSTCSVSGATAGGLVGTANVTDKIADCYATGMVKGATCGAFAGTLTGTASGCYYYEIINEIADKDKGCTYLSKLGTGDKDGITALDADASAYETFVGIENKSASPYDNLLKLYYKGKYQLRTVHQLGANVDYTNDFVAIHYGDWPAPETWVINE